MSVLTSSPLTRFEAPEGAFAAAPPEDRGLARDRVRLLVARPDGVTHRRFADLADELSPGDLVVVNNSATIAGQIDGVRRPVMPTGVPGISPSTAQDSEVVVHVATHLGDRRWVVELRRPPHADRAILDAQPGEVITLGEGVRLRLQAPYPFEGSSPTGSGNRLWEAEVRGDLDHTLRQHGRPISYGYLERRFPLEAYQSVFATVPGSAEMPSAGRPFTPALITRLVAGGVSVAPITLHTGVSSQEAGEGPQPEWFDVPAATARQINAVRRAGGRVVAVGTTVTRAVESSVVQGRATEKSGWTDRVISVDEPPEMVNGLISGWHDPHASHLLLVESVAGVELSQAAYDAAVNDGYLWHEFGDAGLFLPEI